VSVCNGALHSALAILFASLFAWLNEGLPAFSGWQLPGLIIFLAEITVVGALGGGYLYGLKSHRNFLRMRIKDDGVTIYPVGLTDIPKREDWRINDKKKGSPAPAYVPVNDLVPHLIEGPILVDVADKVGAALLAAEEEQLSNEPPSQF
jgi:hypothetical protein